MWKIPRVLRDKRLLLLLAAPLAVYADASGPDPGLSGVPNEAGTCAKCHGTGSVNTMGGSVAISFSGGKSYVPGVVQQWIVTITDSSAKRWGFQATSRTASSSSTQAGGFTSTDSYTQVICSTTKFSGAQSTTTGTCPTSAPLMYVEQTLTGTRTGTTSSITFAFNWTPPSSSVGDITVYVAANAANGNGLDDTGDHVYTATYTLSASTSGSSTTSVPAISTGGVVNGASFASGIEAGSWVTILGTNLTTATSCDAVNNPTTGCRTWKTSDFTNGTPTSLDGVSVSIGGKAAYVYYISPTQINVQAPDIGTGSVSVTVTNANGTSAAVTATADNCAPGFFTSGKYAIATHSDGTLVAPTGTYTGSSPAKAGETITLWGTGFGPVSPTVPAGSTPAAANGSSVSYVTTTPTVTIGSATATVVAGALNPSALGLYQIAITVPSSAASGDQLIVATAGGKSSPTSGVYFTVQ